MNNSKHKPLLDQWKSNAKFTVSTQSSSSSDETSTINSIATLEINKNKPLSIEDQAIKAEILWSLNVVQKKF
jgi:hypothetical protein